MVERELVGDVDRVKREMNLLRHSLINVESQVKRVEKYFVRSVKNSPYVVLGKAGEDSISLISEVIREMENVLEGSIPAYMVESMEDRARELVEDFKRFGLGDWNLALVFEFDDSADVRSVKRSMPILIPSV